MSRKRTVHEIVLTGSFKAIAPAVFLSALAVSALAMSLTQRAVAKRAIEKARYQFVLGEKPDFNKAYPLSFFKKQVAREQEREAVLKRVYDLTVSRRVMAEEYDRIEKSTKAPEQWEAIKAAVHNNRRMIEEIICRPLLVERVLRTKFEFDQKIHAAAHQNARSARAEFLAGRKPAGMTTVTLSRKSDSGESTEAMLEQARADASVPRVLEPKQEVKEPRPLPLEPQAAAVLEKELHKPGDISTILEYRDRFEVYRLLGITPSTWRVEMVHFPKRDFDSWYEEMHSPSR